MGYLIDVTCVKCEHEFEVEEWNSGSCPCCGKEYGWDEQCYGDLDDPDSEYDCYAFIDWY